MYPRQILFAVLTALAAPAALAVTTLDAGTLIGGRGVGCLPGDCKNETYSGTGPTVLEVQDSRFVGAAIFSATANSRGGAGDLGVFVDASVLGPHQVGNLVASGAAAARSQDIVTIQADPASGLTIGSDVSVRLRGAVSFGISSSISDESETIGGGTGFTFLSILRYEWYGLGQPGSTGFSLCATKGGLAGGCGSASEVAPGEYTFDETVQLKVGQELWIDTQLFAVAEAGTNWYGPDEGTNLTAVTVDSWNSQHNYLTALTPGVVFAAASGHDYAYVPLSAVPEPSTIALFVVGLASLPFVRRRSSADHLKVA